MQRFRITSRVLTIAALFALGVSGAQADTYTWTGANGTNWVTGSNWLGSPTLVWSNTTDVVFYSGTGANLTTVLGDANRTIRSLTFDANADKNVFLDLKDATATARTLIFDTDVVGGNATINVDAGAAGTFLIGGGTNGQLGTIQLNDNLVINHNGTGALTISRTITQNSGTYGITKNGTGQLTFGGTSAVSLGGNITINNGRVQVNRTNGFGTGAIVLNDTGAILSQAAVTLTNAVIVSDTGDLKTWQHANGGNATYSGNVTLNETTAGNFKVEVTGAGGLLLDGTISGAGGLEKSGTGVGFLRLSKANTYSGITKVSAGELRLNNNQALQNSALDTGGTGFIAANSGAGTYVFGGLITGRNLASVVTGSAANVTAVQLNPQSGSVTYSDIIANLASGMHLTKSGAGTQVLGGVNTYTGTTTITAGRLEIAAGGSINTSSRVTINGGELKYNSSTPLTPAITFTQGTISGTGTVSASGGVSISTGAILSPGNSPGTLPFATGLTLSPGGTYVWETNSGTGTAGQNWDVINVTAGGLNLSSLSSGGKFNLDLTTLTASGSSGSMDNYTAGGSYTWRIFDANALTLPGSFGSAPYAAGTDITSLFNLVTTNWKNTVPASNDMSVKVAADGTGVDLVVVPEPAAFAVALGGMACMGWFIRRRRGA